MDQESTQLIIAHLDKVAAKLGTTVEYVWPWFVKQQYIDAFYYLFISAIIWGVVFVGLRFSVKHSIYKEDHEELWCFVLIVLIVAGLIAAAFLVIGIFEFPDVFNPELHALRDIIHSVR